MININEDLDTYTGTYIFEDGGDRTSFTKKAYSQTTNVNTCDCNYVVIAGCKETAYLGQPTGTTITLSNVVSPGQVKSTDNFKIELFKDQGLN